MITKYPDNMPEEVKNILARAYNGKERLRLFYGNLETGEAWPEDHEVIGTISASTGGYNKMANKIPLLIASSRSGAPIIGSVVAVRDREQWLYRHPKFNVGKWKVQADEQKIWVYHNGEKHAAFSRVPSAENYALFMQGLRMKK